MIMSTCINSVQLYFQLLFKPVILKESILNDTYNGIIFSFDFLTQQFNFLRRGGGGDGGEYKFPKSQLWQTIIIVIILS